MLNCKWTFFYAPRGRNSVVSIYNPSDYRYQLQDIAHFDTIKGFFESYCFL